MPAPLPAARLRTIRLSANPSRPGTRSTVTGRPATSACTTSIMRLTAALSRVGLSVSTQRWIPEIMAPRSMEWVCCIGTIETCSPAGVDIRDIETMDTASFSSAFSRFEPDKGQIGRTFA